MGYESKIYICRKYNRDNCKPYAMKAAMIDMSKCYPLSDILRRMPATECEIYADDGDTLMDADNYGEPLTECSISQAIDAVRKAIEKDDSDYLMYDVLMSTLKAFAAAEHSDAFVVIHYGY